MKLFSFAMVLATSSLFAATTVFSPIDVNLEHKKEQLRESKGVAPRFAKVNDTSINLLDNSNLSTKNNELIFTHKIIAKASVSLNLAFENIKLSKNAKLSIYSSSFENGVMTFTQNDLKLADLWTPVIHTDNLSVEVIIPKNELSLNRVLITKVNQGFRRFSDKTEKSGSCNVDVACSDSKGWEKEVNAVAVISVGGSTFCTGFMVNNTANDKKPLFMTAHHCEITASNAASLVTYWNYQTKKCSGSRDGKLSDYTTGARFLASSSKSDFTIVQLTSKPKAKYNVKYAGWDRSDTDASSAVAIHHPNTDEKSISFEYDPTTTTSYGDNDTPGDGTHVRVTNWDVGTTEPGSSGSPLFNQDHRVIGQLHGGYASCSSKTSDWYGKLESSWDGQGKDSNSLKKWLDPINSGAMVTDTI